MAAEGYHDDERERINDAVASRFAAELERLPAMLHATDRHGRLVAVSDRWLATLGYARGDVIGRQLADFLVESPSESGGDPVERQMRCGDGRIIDVLISRTDGSLALVMDVTAAKAEQRRLAASEARYRGLIEDQSEFVSLATPEGELRFVNRAYARRHQTTPEAMVGRSLFDFVRPQDRERVAGHLKAVLAGRETITDENQVVLPNGETRWFAWTNRALLDPEGRVTAIHSVGRDVDRSVRAEARLRESELRYRMLADHSTDMVFQLDRDLVRQYVSPSCRDVLGYEPDELVAARPFGLVHPEDAERVGRLLKSVLTGESERQEAIYRFRHRNGRWIWVEALFRALREPEAAAATGVIGALRDISARKTVEDQLAKANRRLETLAAQDGLTGLANRRAFDDALSREHQRVKRRTKGLGVAMIDVDWFKPFNDSYGHLAGDECLRRLGKAIADTATRAGDTVARYGGEEFVALLPDIDEKGAALIGERIRESVARLAIEHRASPLGVVSVSVGIAATEPRAPDGGPDALLRLADRALYEAKSRGRNLVARASSLTGADFAAA